MDGTNRSSDSRRIRRCFPIVCTALSDSRQGRKRACYTASSDQQSSPFAAQFISSENNFDMERAARLIKRDGKSQQILGDDEMVRGIWPAAVGNAIARHTVRLKVVRKTLVVEMEDSTWQRQLFPLSKQIVERVQKLLGSSGIDDVEFRVGAMRRPLQREERTLATQSDVPAAQSKIQDEAEDILDPVLKKVYRNSRKRATA